MNSDADRDGLQSSIREVLREECAIDTIQRHVLSGRDFDDSLWHCIASLGWLGLSISDQHGGLGLGMDALAILYRELGRALAPVPVLSTLLAADAIQELGNEQQRQRWLPAIAAGRLRATISDPTRSVVLDARRQGSDIVLEGGAEVLLDGALTDLSLLLVNVDGQLLFAVLDRATPGVTLEQLPVVDQTRSFGRLSLDDVTITSDRVLGGSAVESVCDRLMLHAAVAVASDAMGGAESILASTIEYLKLRQQFGKVIGTFQALKHRVADHHVAIIGAEALVENVAEEASRGRPDLAGALECKALATSVYARIAQDCIQLHGGIGFTWEHPAHLFLKRALVDATLFGSVEQTLDRFIARLGV